MVEIPGNLTRTEPKRIGPTDRFLLASYLSNYVSQNVETKTERFILFLNWSLLNLWGNKLNLASMKSIQTTKMFYNFLFSWLLRALYLQNHWS